MNSITSLAGQRRIATKPDALPAEVDALKRLQSGIAAELDALGISHQQEFKE